MLPSSSTSLVRITTIGALQSGRGSSQQRSTGLLSGLSSLSFAILNNSTFIVCFDYICVNIGNFSLEEALASLPQKLPKTRARVVVEEEEDNSKRIRLANNSNPGPSSFQPSSNPGPSSFLPTSPAARAATPRPSSNPGPSMATPRRIIELSGLDCPEAAAPQSFKTPTKQTRLDVSRGTPDHKEGGEELLLQEPSPFAAAAGKALELAYDDDWSLQCHSQNLPGTHISWHYQT